MIAAAGPDPGRPFSRQAREGSDRPRGCQRAPARYLEKARSMPVPERQQVLDLLAREGVPMSLDAIADAFRLPPGRERKRLFRALRSMQRNGEVLRNRAGEYGLTERMDLVRGRVIGHRDGYGFLVPDEGGGDLFLSPRQMRSVMHGDRIVARVDLKADRRKNELLVLAAHKEDGIDEDHERLGMT